MQEQRTSHFASRRALLLAGIVGLALGALAKVADQSPVPGIGDVGTHLGVWVVVITAASVTAPSRAAAAARSALLMIAMVAGYYTAAYLYFRVIPVLDIVVWSTGALTGVPALAALVWPARHSGWASSIAAAIPVGLLAAEALTFRHYIGMGLHIAPFAFDLLAALALLWLLPSTWRNRLRSGFLALPVAIVGMWAITVGFSHAAGLLMRALV